MRTRFHCRIVCFSKHPALSRMDDLRLQCVRAACFGFGHHLRHTDEPDEERTSFLDTLLMSPVGRIQDQNNGSKETLMVGSPDNPQRRVQSVR